MEFFVEYDSCKEWKSDKKVNTLSKLINVIKELKKQEGENVYYQVYVKDMHGNYAPIEIELDAIRWEEMEW